MRARARSLWAMGLLRELAALLRLSRFRLLFATRVTSQLGDGVFQMGLATVLFFSPERASTTGGVALAYAVMLGPFTLVGPWAGVLIDVWRRRSIMVAANALRAIVAIVIAVSLWSGGPSWVLYVGLLGVLTVNRFLLSAFSAGQPLVVGGPLLLTANALSPTLGAGASFLGASLAAAATAAMPAGADRDGVLVAAAAVVFATAAALAARFRPDELGPTVALRLDRGRGTEAGAGGAGPWSAVAAGVGQTSRGLVDGARHLWVRRTPALALAAVGAHRLLYGVTFVAALLVSRNVLADEGSSAPGLGIFALALAATAVGGAGAAVVTPVLGPRLPGNGWVVVALGVAALAQVPLVVAATVPTLVASAVLSGFGAQALKITVDTIVQRDTSDAFRGRAFALYDVVYNATFVLAAVLAVLVLPDDGYSAAVYAGIGGAFVLLATGYAAASRRLRALSPPSAPATT